MAKPPASLLLAAALVGLGACKTTDDPRQGGLISGVAGLASGSYQKRLDAKQGDLAAAESESERLDAERAAIDRDQAEVRTEIAALEQGLAELDRDLATLAARIAEGERAQRITSEQAADLKREIDELERAKRLLDATPDLQSDTKQKRLKQLADRRRELEITLEDALLQ